MTEQKFCVKYRLTGPTAIRLLSVHRIFYQARPGAAGLDIVAMHTRSTQPPLSHNASDSRISRLFAVLPALCLVTRVNAQHPQDPFWRTMLQCPPKMTLCVPKTRRLATRSAWAKGWPGTSLRAGNEPTLVIAGASSRSHLTYVTRSSLQW